MYSSHEFYIQLETLSGRIFAPVHQGELRPTKWFFERTKKQYNQPLLTKTKAEQNSYKALYPPKQKITIEDAAKYLNLANMRPFDVAWGAQENAKKFHKTMEQEWDKSSSFCDDLYFERLVGMAIFYRKLKILLVIAIGILPRKEIWPRLLHIRFLRSFMNQNCRKEILIF